VSWDWQKLLEKKNPEPPAGDSSFGGLAAEASEQEPAEAGDAGQAEIYARGAAGMAWHPMGASDNTGPSMTKGGLPQLLYGQEHKCAFCRGAGQMPGAHQCPVCRGTAKVRFTPPVVRCAFCYGGGRVPLRSNATCPACRGWGVVKVRPPIQVCAKCKGRGKQMGAALYCGRCRGSGVVTVSAWEGSIERDARPRIDRMAAAKSQVAAPGPPADEAAPSGRPGGPRKQEQGLRWDAAPKATRQAARTRVSY